MPLPPPPPPQLPPPLPLPLPPPLLFLDVDGPLIPFGGPGPYPEYGADRTPPPAHPLLSRIDPALGPRLLALRCAPVWATTWGTDANTVVGPWLGLPPLPVLPVEDDPDGPQAPVRGLHWKTLPLLARAAGRPFVWLDDEIGEADRTWVAAAHPAPALLHRVDPQHGLTDADFATVRAWLDRPDGAVR
ncbi:hypothetical protein ACFWNK_10730 [Streptomyces sp. NPDC058417]|uniref:hypothetical protein n=1 Tax=unclassified Streptomyces TaxID=2593676 RepID=UPI0036535BB5